MSNKHSQALDWELAPVCRYIKEGSFPLLLNGTRSPSIDLKDTGVGGSGRRVWSGEGPLLGPYLKDSNLANGILPRVLGGQALLIVSLAVRGGSNSHEEDL